MKMEKKVLTSHGAPTKISTLHFLILAGISNGIVTGYELAKWLNKISNHYWSVNHSSIYPALRSLQEKKWISFTAEASSEGPDKKVYSINPVGVLELKNWVLVDPLPSEVKDEQIIKALGFDLVDATLAIEQLQKTQKLYEMKLSFCENSLQQIRKESKRTNHNIGWELTILRGVYAASGYVEWCKHAILILEKKKK